MLNQCPNLQQLMGPIGLILCSIWRLTLAVMAQEKLDKYYSGSGV